MDGRRKLAAKRVQDELQQHKEILDALVEELRSGEARSQQVLGLIRSQAPMTAIAEHVLQYRNSATNESRTKVPIDLLIQAEEILSRRTSSETPGGPSNHYSASPPGQYFDTPPIPSLSVTRSNTTIGSVDTDFEASHRFVQNLYNRSESEAFSMLHELRRTHELSEFLNHFRLSSPESSSIVRSV